MSLLVDEENVWVQSLLQWWDEYVARLSQTFFSANSIQPSMFLKSEGYAPQ